MRGILILAAVFFAGCAGDHDAVQKRLADLRKDIQRLQSSNDTLSDRLDSLEGKMASSPAIRPEPSDKRVERPPLRVVKLVPGAAEAETTPDGATPEVAPDERPDAPGQRPMIRLRGSSKESRSSEGSDTLARQAAEDNR